MLKPNQIRSRYDVIPTKRKKKKKLMQTRDKTRSQIETERERNAEKKRNSCTFFHLIKLVNGGKRRATGGRRTRGE